MNGIWVVRKYEVRNVFCRFEEHHEESRFQSDYFY